MFERRNVLCLIMLAALMLASATPLARALEVGTAPPDFSLTTLDGKKVSLASLRGKVVIVDFWASWCAPCKEEMPVLESLYKRFGSKGLVVVGVSVDNDRKNAKTFIDGMKVSFPIVHDADKSVAGKFKPPRMPTSYVIDKAGKVRFVHAGFRKDDAKELEEQVVSLLK